MSSPTYFDTDYSASIGWLAFMWALLGQLGLSVEKIKTSAHKKDSEEEENSMSKISFLLLTIGNETIFGIITFFFPFAFIKTDSRWWQMAYFQTI